MTKSLFAFEMFDLSALYFAITQSKCQGYNPGQSMSAWRYS